MTETEADSAFASDVHAISSESMQSGSVDEAPYVSEVGRGSDDVAANHHSHTHSARSHTTDDVSPRGKADNTVIDIAVSDEEFCGSIVLRKGDWF